MDESREVGASTSATADASTGANGQAENATIAGATDEVKCARKGCARKATHHLGWHVWAIGVEKTRKNATEGRLDFPFCKDHAAAAKPKEIITKKAWLVIATNAQSKRFLPADPDSLEFHMIRGLPARFRPKRAPKRLTGPTEPPARPAKKRGAR